MLPPPHLQGHAEVFLKEEHTLEICMAMTRTTARKPAEKKAKEYAEDCLKIFNEQGMLDTRSHRLETQ